MIIDLPTFMSSGTAVRLSSIGMPELRENYGFSRKDLVKIADELDSNLELLCKRWREIHEDH